MNEVREEINLIQYKLSYTYMDIKSLGIYSK